MRSTTRRAGRRSVRCMCCDSCMVSVFTDDGAPECTGDKAGVHFQGRELTGVFDTVFLFCYAMGLFWRCVTSHHVASNPLHHSGTLAERSNLRLFLAVGMLGSALCCALLGLAYFADVHRLWLFLLISVCHATHIACVTPRRARTASTRLHAASLHNAHSYPHSRPACLPTSPPWALGSRTASVFHTALHRTAHRLQARAGDGRVDVVPAGW